MPTVSSPAALPQYIEKLLSERHAHIEAVTKIDQTLARVSAALGGSMPAAVPVAKAPAYKAAATAAKAPTTRRRRTGVTANDWVLDFIKANKNPTSQEINAAWKAAGRLGFADNNLSLLTKAKKLKRTPLGEGMRGSRYSLA